MIGAKLARHQKTLSRLAHKHRKRMLMPLQGIDFTSNDYLALAHSPRIKQAVITALKNGVAIGSGGSRLLRGNHDVFEALESAAALFFNSEKTLYFNSGYTANIALFATLPQHGDLVLYDERSHASILDGVERSRADSVAIRHNDVEHCASILQKWRHNGGIGRPWIAVESLYSMDGDRAPLSALFELANANDGFLVIDEAHATGVYGPSGQGLALELARHDNVIMMHTCSKAIGAAGALVCINRIFYDYLIQCARPFIFSTAPSPLMAVAVSEALKILLEEPWHRHRLTTLLEFANKKITLLPNIVGSGSQILPVIIGDNQLASRIAMRMQEIGFDLRAIRPPTVPEGSARLRIAITLHADEAAISHLFEQLSMIIKEEL